MTENNKVNEILFSITNYEKQKRRYFRMPENIRNQKWFTLYFDFVSEIHNAKSYIIIYRNLSQSLQIIKFEDIIPVRRGNEISIKETFVFRKSTKRKNTFTERQQNGRNTFSSSRKTKGGGFYLSVVFIYVVADSVFQPIT